MSLFINETKNSKSSWIQGLSNNISLDLSPAALLQIIF